MDGHVILEAGSLQGKSVDHFCLWNTANEHFPNMFRKVRYLKLINGALWNPFDIL